MSSSEALRGLVRRTPVVPLAGAPAAFSNTCLKLENLQRTGSFKLRGAVARIASLTAEERALGVVSSSAGNHGVGVALAAKTIGVNARIVVPTGAPATKCERIRQNGAEVIARGSCYDEAEAVARELAAQVGAVFVSPFDDELVIEGNGGSLADELIEQVASLGRVLCPVGGGGLIGGLARRLAPRGVSVVGVQPEMNCAMYESLAQGRALTVYEGRPTLAEGCEGAVSERTFALARDLVEEIVLVSEDAIRRAVAFLYDVAGTIAECSAAVPVAALLEGVVPPAPDRTTVVVITGGNIDPVLLDEILRTSR